jgi:hypothetical protein
VLPRTAGRDAALAALAACLVDEGAAAFDWDHI